MPMSQPAPTTAVTANTTNDAVVQYVANQIVCYKSNGKRTKAQVLKKHLDDQLDPFYTIVLHFGKEKQTDAAHLEPLGPAYEKIESTLLSLSASQLQQVENFLSSNMAIETHSSSMSTPAVSNTNMQAPVAAPIAETMKPNSQAPTNVAVTGPATPLSMGGMMAPSAAAATTMNGASPSAIPSPLPVTKPPVHSMGGIPALNMGGQANNTEQTIQQPNVQQQRQHQPQMQGQMQGHNPAPQMMQQLPQQQRQRQQQPPQMGQFQQQPGGQPQMMMQQQPMQGQNPAPQMRGQLGGQPQMMMQQQQPMQGQQPPQMQGQPGGQPQMMMQQQPMQGQQPPQMQGQPGGQPQRMMQQQPMQGQQQQQPQMQGQMGQAPPPSPQGNPFDMY